MRWISLISFGPYKGGFRSRRWISWISLFRQTARLQACDRAQLNADTEAAISGRVFHWVIVLGTKDFWNWVAEQRRNTFEGCSGDKRYLLRERLSSSFD